MILLVEPDQVKQCWDLINVTIERSYPTVQEHLKTDLLYDLLLGTAQVWVITHGDNQTLNNAEGMFITRISESFSTGGRALTVLAACAFTGANDEMFLSSFNALKEYGLARDCQVVDFFTNNDAIMNYVKKLSILWECKYVQLNLKES